MKETWKKRFLPLLLTLSMVFAAAAPGMTSQAAETPDQKIVILYTNDVHCGVDDNIGYAGLALYEKQMEAQTPYVALVDAGDGRKALRIPSWWTPGTPFRELPLERCPREETLWPS